MVGRQILPPPPQAAAATSQSSTSSPAPTLQTRGSLRSWKQAFAAPSREPAVKEEKPVSIVEPVLLAAARSGQTVQDRRAALAAKRRKKHGSYIQTASLGMMGFTEGRAVGAPMRQRYGILMNTFDWFCLSVGLSTGTTESADAALVEYADFLYFEGYEKAEFSATLAAWADKFPRFTRHGDLRLPRAARALQGFSKLAPASTRPPISWNILCLIALEVLRAESPAIALAMVVMFVCYFRPGEIFGVEAGDVAPPIGQFQHTAINVFPSERVDRNKTGLADLSLLLDAPYASFLGPVVAQLAARRKGRMLIESTYVNMKVQFERAQETLQLPQKFVLYQIRHGGPSHDRAHRVRSMLEIKNRGQWSSDASVKRYEGHARLQQVESRLDAALARRAAAAPALLAGQLRSSLGAMAAHKSSSNTRQSRASTGGPSGAPQKSSAEVTGSRKRLHEKASPARLGTPSTTAPTTCSLPVSSTTSSSVCELASSSSSTLRSPAAHGRARGAMMVGGRLRSATTLKGCMG